MTVIWGLDLKEMQWRKFKSSYMWSNTYHQRRRRFCVYQLAMILCVVSESLGTDALSNYVEEQSNVERYSAQLGGPVSIQNNDIVGSFSYNIFVGVYVATIFGAAFFFDLFWPERKEIPRVQLAWKICSILTVCFALSSAMVLTVVLTTHKAVLTGPVQGANIRLAPPLAYKENGEAIASVVLIWLGWLATIWSTYLMWSNIAHNKKYGPFSAVVRRKKEDLESVSNPAARINSGGRDHPLSLPTEDNTRVPLTEEERKLDEKDENSALSSRVESLGDAPVREPYSIPTPALPTSSIGKVSPLGTTLGALET